MGVLRVVPVGARACLAEVRDALAAASLADWARARGIAADEIVPAAATVLFDGVDPDEVGDALGRWPGQSGERTGPVVRVPVDYSGPDLDAVASHWRCAVEDVVRLHTSIEFVALFSGFAPGFCYLGGLPADRAIPRLASPRSRVPAGSVAIADAWCGVYPTASPGGWHLLGTTDAVLWDARRAQPALLAPGTRVAFVDARNDDA